MKLVLKLLIYSAVIVVLIIASLTLFRNHPEVQIAFFVPGIFILVYSIMRDELYVDSVTRIRMSRGK